MDKSTKKAEDLIMKNVFDLLKGDAIQFFGINKKIVAPAKNELNFIELKTNFDDNVYLLDDGTFIHFEYQTTKKRSDLYRFMVSDAMLAYKEQRPVKTIIIYSADIIDTETWLDLDSITYKVDAFYMIAFDGDMIYNDLKKKIENNGKLSKQDLMSIVLIPIMKSQNDKLTRIKNCIDLSKKISDKNEFMQIQAMLYLIAEKFVTANELDKVKEMINMMPIMEMILNEKINEKSIEVARKALLKGMAIEDIAEITGLDQTTIKNLQNKLFSKQI